MHYTILLKVYTGPPICSLERADTPLAETRTRPARRQANDCIQWGTIRRASQIPSNFVRHDTAGFTNSIQFRTVPLQNSPCTCRLQGILTISSARGLPLEHYLWRQHSSVNSSSSAGRCRCRAVSRWRTLPARRQLMVSPVVADKIISLWDIHRYMDIHLHTDTDIRVYTFIHTYTYMHTYTYIHAGSTRY
jgi:hypothetical protein